MSMTMVTMKVSDNDNVEVDDDDDDDDDKEDRDVVDLCYLVDGKVPKILPQCQGPLLKDHSRRCALSLSSCCRC